MLYSEGEYERNVCPAEMGRIIDRSEWIKWGVGEMGIVKTPSTVYGNR
jgi:hypothetical protein